MHIAGISYINALPLLFGLRENPLVQLELDTPAVCWQKLVHGQVDLALVPVFGLQLNPAIRAVKGLGIAAAQRTESVYLFARQPLSRIQTVITDRASMTSVLLLKIILKARYSRQPEFHSAPVDNLHEALRRYDAALLIGDDAILAEKTDYDHYDLATEWHSLTDLSFIFAVWASNRTLSAEETGYLNSSYQTALMNQEAIYDQAAQILPVDRQFLKRYYNDNLHYQLVRKDYEGLLRFLSLAAEFQFIDRVRKDIWL